MEGDLFIGEATCRNIRRRQEMRRGVSAAPAAFRDSLLQTVDGLFFPSPSLNKRKSRSDDQSQSFLERKKTPYIKPV